MCLGTINI